MSLYSLTYKWLSDLTTKLLIRPTVGFYAKTFRSKSKIFGGVVCTEFHSQTAVSRKSLRGEKTVFEKRSATIRNDTWKT